MGRESTPQRMPPHDLGSNAEESLEKPWYQHDIFDVDQTCAKPDFVATVNRGYYRSSYRPYSKRRTRSTPKREERPTCLAKASERPAKQQG